MCNSYVQYIPSRCLKKAPIVVIYPDLNAALQELSETLIMYENEGPLARAMMQAGRNQYHPGQWRGRAEAGISMDAKR
jgi:hypothetical protein